MNEQSLMDSLELLGIRSYKRSGDYYYMVECPDAARSHAKGQDHKPSCSVGHTERPSYFSCFACGFRGSVLDVAFTYFQNNWITREIYWKVRDICNKSKEQESEPEEILKRLSKQREDIRNTFVPQETLDLFERKINKWLITDKNLTVDVCKKFGIRHNPNNNMVVMPVYDKQGLRGITQRNMGNKGSKYLSNEGFKNHHFLFGENHFADVCSPLPTAGGIIIVEGQFDTMYMHQIGFTNTLGLFSSNITTDQVTILSRYDKPVYVFLDNDEAGRRGTLRAACMIADKMPCYTVGYPENIPEKADPKRLTSEQIIDLLDKAEYSLG